MRQQITCTKCKCPSSTYEATLVLSLDCLGTVGQGLSRLTANELLTGKNKYKCGTCKTMQDARKQTTIYNAPENLIIHLKRFHFAGKSSKLTKPVEFEQRLDLGQYMSPGRPSGIYKLVGVLVHQGSSASTGHYYAFGKGSHGTWNEFNDTSVSQSGIERVLRQQAYMLFYVRDTNLTSSIPTSTDRQLVDGLKQDLVEGKYSNSSSRGRTFEEMTQGPGKKKKRRHSVHEEYAAFRLR